VLFTLGNYARLLAVLESRGFATMPVVEYLETPPADGFAILRHDCEWDPRKALAMGRLETERGFRATYYFHGPHRERVFDVAAMQAIERLGHEVGYHYETLDRTGGDMAAARALFETDVVRFRDAGIDLRTVAYHGNPRVDKSSYELNGDLIARDPEILAANRLLGEADLTVDISAMEYVSDVGIRFSTISGDPLAFLSQPSVSRVYLMIHSDYWSATAFGAVGMQVAAAAMRHARPVARIGWVVKDRISH
jgi:hypothetical protein